jgi:hypothetical protein
MVGGLGGAFASPPALEKRMKSTWNRWMGSRRMAGERSLALPQLTLPRLALAAAASLTLALGLSACENVAGYTQPSLVRVIDASYIAPAVNIFVEGTEMAANIGEGYISGYGALPASNSAVVVATAATATGSTGSNILVSSNATLLAGHQHSAFLTDNGAAPTSYTLTVLEDQQIAAAAGHSAFRFVNEAPRTGPVDIYMVPSGTTLANTIPLYSGLAVGSTAGYISFASQTVTMVIVPAGTTTPKYTSAGLALTGGEVRTVMIVDSQLTSDPPVSVVIADDVN